MKKNLLIKLNDIVVDTSTQQDKAVKKSIEFFMGSIIPPEDIEDFRKRKCPANSHDCINQFLSEKGIFLREAAIMKKFSEYYLGREFDGLIKDSSLIISRKSLEKLSERYNLVLLSLMNKDETKAIAKNLRLNKIDIISSGSAKEGVSSAAKKFKKIEYLGNSIIDYEAASENKIFFIGFNIDKGKPINKIEEIL